ncbi:MAG TPA: hypothetical protein VIG49_12105 [Acetobacteraceae bacterium]
MGPVKSLLIAAPVAVGLLAAPAAHADWRHRGGGWGGHEQHYGHGGGGVSPVAGALIGLGVGALIGGVIASQAAPVYAAPPVAYAPPPAYYPPAPTYYAAPPPAYYATPAYAPYGYSQ